MIARESDSGVKDFPSLIVRAIEALGDKNRRQILISLNNSCRLAYSQILQLTGLEKGTLNHHLEKLVSGALVRNFRGDSPASVYTSFYELSPIGHRLVDQIFGAFEPSITKAFTATSVTAPSEPMLNAKVARPSLKIKRPVSALTR
jgi:DNA-binding transcriptional ArsR family regulator